MAEVLNKDVVFCQVLPDLSEQGKKGVMCLDEIAGHGNCKQNKNKLNDKKKSSCAKCMHTVCRHAEIVIM